MISSPGIDGRHPVVEAHLTVRVLAKLGLFVVATVLLIAAIGRAQQLIGLVILAGVLSATLAPLIEWLRSKVNTLAATLVVHIIVLVALVSTTAFIVQQIRVESERLETYAAAQLAEIDEDDAPIAFSRADLSRRASEATASWGTTAVLGDDEAAGIAMRAAQLIVIIVLSTFFTLQADRIIDAVARTTSDRDRRRVVRQMWSEGVNAGSSQLRNTLLHSAVAGAVVAGSALLFGLPGVALVGFWAACASAVPFVGPVVGWTPVVIVGMLTLETRSLVALALIAVASVTLHGVARAKTCPDFRVGPLIITLGVAAGLNAGGIPGAAAGLFIFTGLAHAAANHQWTKPDAADPAVAGGPAVVTGTDLDAGHPADPAERSQTGGVYVDLSSETLLRVGGLVVLAVMIQLSLARTGAILIWAIVGLLIAVGIDRPVTWLHGRTGARRSSIVVTGSLVLLTIFGVLAISSGGGATTVGSIDEDLPRFTETIEDLPLVGDRLADLDLDRSITELQRRAPTFLDRSPIAGDAARLVGGGLVALFWIVATTIAALIDGPRVAGAIDRRVPARYTRQVNRLSGAARSALAGYVAGSALVAAINAALVGVISTAAGVPLPMICAVWAFSWNFVPQIGAVLGWAPTLFLALIINPLVGLGCLAFFVVYQVVENNLIQPTIVGHAVDISALAALGAALAGAAIAGLVGAVLAIPVVGVVHAIRTEIARDDFPSLSDRRSNLGEI